MVKIYYKNGNLKNETPFINNSRKEIPGGIKNIIREYYEDGRLKSETI